MRSRSGASSRVINLIALAVSTTLSALPAFAMEIHRFDIPEESASAAIRDFGAQAHVQVLVAGEFVRNKKLHAVSGHLSTEQALDKMLEGSGLAHKYVGDGSIALIPVSLTTDQSQTPGSAQPGDPGKGGQDSSGRFLLAQAAQGQTAGPGAVAGGSSGSQQSGGETPIQEVIVTAQKREERLQDVPVPITALNTADLADNDQYRLQDYYNQVPGLTLATDNRGAPVPAIRGLTTGLYNNSTVGITVDQVPFGATTVAAYSWAAADLDPNELSRIEVLRGPQGTLFGVNSLGGLINYVTMDPSTSELSGRVQIGGVGVQNGDELGYSVNAGVNVPLSDTLAVRASAFTHLDPGYIDNVLTGQRDVNWGVVSGGRIASLWTPTSDFSLKLSALVEANDTHGSDYLEPSLGDLTQSYVRDTGGYNKTLEAFSATINYSFGPATLTSITGYGINGTDGSFDVSSSSFLRSQAEKYYGVGGVPWEESNETKKLSEELRLEAKIGETIDWLLGAFYTNEQSYIGGGWVGADPLTGEVSGPLLTETAEDHYREYAAFTDLTVHFTSEFDIQFGARESYNRQTYNETDIGPIVPKYDGFPSPYQYPTGDVSENAFTYLVTPEFKMTSGLMLYARFASGFRPGGPNIGLPPALGLPLTYAPDKTDNYEIGIKADFLDHSLSVDTSAYYIDWKNIQVTVYDPTTGEGYVANPGGAKSQGIELNGAYAPVRVVKFSGWLDLNDAVLTQEFPATSYLVGVPGDKLPYSSRFSAHGALDYELPRFGTTLVTLGAGETYVGSREGEFLYTFSSGARQVYPAYAQTDLRATARMGEWSLRIFGNNIADKRALISGGNGTFNPAAFTVIQPRTVGINLTRTF